MENGKPALETHIPKMKTKSNHQVHPNFEVIEEEKKKFHHVVKTETEHTLYVYFRPPNLLPCHSDGSLQKSKSWTKQP